VNIGVILGSASGGLADIDLDCAEADAMEAVGLPTIDAKGKFVEGLEVNCDVGDPWAYVLSMNVARRHLTTQQRLKLLDKVTKANPSISSRRVAKLVGVSHTTAAMTSPRTTRRVRI
jgi:hypothetical protein